MQIEQLKIISHLHLTTDHKNLIVTNHSKHLVKNILSHILSTSKRRLVAIFGVRKKKFAHGRGTQKYEDTRRIL